MHALKDIILAVDIYNLKKSTLQEICKKLDIPENEGKNTLASRVLKTFKEKPQSRSVAYAISEDTIFGGKPTSAIWFHSTTDGIAETATMVVKNLSFNPFLEIKHPIRAAITDDPILICGAKGNIEGEYFFRYVYRSGETREMSDDGVDTRPRISYSTLYVNENEKFIEIRAERRAAIKIINNFSGLIGQKVSIAETKVLGRYGDNIEKFADALGGQLVDMQAKPGLLLQEFTKEQATAVVDIITAIDTYFKDPNARKLTQMLDLAKESLGDQNASTTFTALILSGMEKVRFGSSKDKDLRLAPLYEVLKNSLEQHGNSIRFHLEGEGYFTIKVGKTTNSIVFLTTATEKAIEYVRKHVII